MTNYTFRFPIACAHYCSQWGFQTAMHYVKRFAIIPTTEDERTAAFDIAARDFLDTAMKTRKQAFASDYRTDRVL